MCADEPEVDPDKYGGVPYVKCQCWQQGEGGVTESIVPFSNAGANIILGGEDSFVGGAGGEAMCDAIKADPANIKVYFVYYLDKYDAEAEAIGKHCASGDDKFIYATDRDKLIETFRKIGQEISRLRLVPYEVSSTGKSQ